MAGELRGRKVTILAGDGAGQAGLEQFRQAAGQAWRVRLPRWRDDRRMGRDRHECEHEVVREAIAGGSHAPAAERSPCRRARAGLHGDEDLPALEVLHDRCHGSVVLTGRWVPAALTGLWVISLAVVLGLPDGIWAPPSSSSGWAPWPWLPLPALQPRLSSRLSAVDPRWRPKGLALSPASNTATFRVPDADAGVASAMVNTQQQIGTSIGTALLNTLAISATTSYLTTHLTGAHPSAALTSLSLIHGYTTAFWWAASILAAGAVICGTLLRRGALAGQGDSGQQAAPAQQRAGELAVHV
jgi:hypothetical protein